MAGTYEFEYTSEGAHGHIVGLLNDHLPRGVVFDVGCGHAPHAEELRKRGFELVGFEIDPDAIASLRTRGFTAHAIDLGAVDDVRPVLDRAAEELALGTEVVAVLALDVLEHLVDPQSVLGKIADWMRARPVGALGLSIPNVSHIDVAAKLLNARWEMTTTGLLDETHLRFFTDSSLGALVGAAGLTETHRDDVDSPVSDQHWPPNHPLLAHGTPLGELLRRVRRMSDDHATTYQFVRLYQPASMPPPADPSPRDRPFLTVVLDGPLGDHSAVVQALESQTVDDYEVIAADPDRFGDDAVREAAARATGRYLAVLRSSCRPDQNWVEQYAAAAQQHPGVVLRCAPNAAHRGLGEVEQWGPFDPLAHLTADATPTGAAAFPVEALDSLNIDVDGRGLTETHALLLELGPFCGVIDTGVPALAVGPAWRMDEIEDPLAAAIERLDASGIVLGDGATRRLVDLATRLAAAERRTDMLAADNEWLNRELGTRSVRLLRRMTRRPPPATR